MESPVRGSLKLDIASAYLLTATRIGAWMVVSSYVYHGIYIGALSTLALVRSTLGLLTYVGLGLGPAMVHHLAAAFRKNEPVLPAIPIETPARLEYATPRRERPTATLTERFYFNGLLVSFLTSVIAFAVLLVFAVSFNWDRAFVLQPGRAERFAQFFGWGIVLRLFSESSGAMLQACGKVALDNVLQCVAEFSWAMLIGVGYFSQSMYGQADQSYIVHASEAFLFSGMILVVIRVVAAHLFASRALIDFYLTDWSLVRKLIAFGGLVTVAQLADFLYAPTDNILITAFVGADRVATYVPAIQVDAALLLTVSAAATALFPRAAIEHAAGNLAAIRRYYRQGTIASVILLTIGALAAWLFSPILFRLWLHDPMPATQAILPLVLIHTVIGGSSAVGRSILLAIGKVKPFTIAVLIAGVTNVILSFIFVRYFHLGLPGIIYGTIIAVVGRCGIWMPWYIARTLRRGDLHPEKGVEVQPLPEI